MFLIDSKDDFHQEFAPERKKFDRFPKNLATSRGRAFRLFTRNVSATRAFHPPVRRSSFAVERRKSQRRRVRRDASLSVGKPSGLAPERRLSARG